MVGLYSESSFYLIHFFFFLMLNIVVWAHLTRLMLSFNKILRVLACGQSCGHVVSLVVMWSVLWSCGHVVSLLFRISIFLIVFLPNLLLGHT